MSLKISLVALLAATLVVALVFAEEVKEKKEEKKVEEKKTDDSLTRLPRHAPYHGSGCPEKRYRTIDGTCNNAHNPLWGRSSTPYARFLPPDYSDGKGLPRARKDGSPLPNPRFISVSLAHDMPVDAKHLSHLFMLWGQFINHEITNKPEAKIKDGHGKELKCCESRHGIHDHPDCYPIHLAPEDPYYGTQNVECMEFTRSVSWSGHEFPVDYREQYNNNTHFIDASNVYGSFDEEAHSLRDFHGGRLAASHQHHGKDLLPNSHGKKRCGRERCFKAGDFRANMFPALSSLHTLFVREHNRIADELYRLNPHWDDQKIYQETRKIVGAQIQHITYNEYLPLVLGPENTKTWELALQHKGYYDGYDPYVNPAIDNAFAAAAYRFGHSLVSWSFKRYSPDHVELMPSPPLSTEFDNTTAMYQAELDLIFLGLLNQPCRARDEYFTEQLTNHLFENRGIGQGQDLYAINIHRGRDNGIPAYNEWRNYCGLKKAYDFKDLRGEIPEEIIGGLQEVFGSVDDLDLYPAGVAEHAIYNGVVGPTFACIIAQQFRNLRKGDRFWYENGGHKGAFTLDQLEAIRQLTLSRVICDNTDLVETVQVEAFRTPGKSNPRVHCTDVHSLPVLDLSAWADHAYGHEEAYPEHHDHHEYPGRSKHHDYHHRPEPY